MEHDLGSALTKEGCVHEGQLELEEMLLLMANGFEKGSQLRSYSRDVNVLIRCNNSLMGIAVVQAKAAVGFRGLGSNIP